MKRVGRLRAAILYAFMVAGPGWGAVSPKPTLRPHAGPHGGTLVTIEGSASIEIVYDCPSGRLTAHVLGPRGAALPIRQDHLRVQVTYADVDGRPIEGPAAHFVVDLEPVPPKRETQSVETSEFSAYSSLLQGICRFVGTVERLEIGQTPLQGIPFAYPGP
jgi:hypothetical protein